MNGFAHARVVPPEMLRVVVAVVECGIQPVKESFGCQRYRVSEEREVHVGRGIKFELSGIFAGEPCFGGSIEVKRVALCLAQLSANAGVVFVIALVAVGRIGQLKVAQFICQEYLNACLGPFVEPFEHGYGKGVADVVVACAVEDGVARERSGVVESVEVEVGGGLVGLIDALVVVEL